MALSYDFLITRAEEAAKEAETATLENVRLRALRSESVWRDMADREMKSAKERERARLERVNEKMLEEAARSQAEGDIP
ncbi:hypothetical protein [Altererythrobacter sp.]|uniref:hypothetical protein n=1 Tax=Altererythrobacter sp. TaxID=1872480 RepID=UPI003D05C7EE